MEKSWDSTAAAVRTAVDDLFSRAPAFARLPPERRQQIARDTASVADSLVAGTTANVDLPDFVAEVIHGTFDAIVNASIRQMEAYAELVRKAAQSVDAFADENVSDNELRDHLGSPLPSKLATKRQQRLATMVLMGINRIVVTKG